MRDITLRLGDHRHHPLQDTLVSPEKIDERSSDNKNKAADKATEEEQDLCTFYQFFGLEKVSGFEKIEDQKDQRDQGIVDTEFQKGVRGGGQETEILTEKDKGRDIPAHDEHPDSRTDDSITDRVHIAEVFRREKKWIGSEGLHETAIHCTEEDKPEQQKHLVLPEMEEQ